MIETKVYCESLRKNFRFLGNEKETKKKYKNCLKYKSSTKKSPEEWKNWPRNSLNEQFFESQGVYFDKDLEMCKKKSLEKNNSLGSELGQALLSIKDKSKERRVKSNRCPNITFWRLMSFFFIIYSIILLAIVTIPYVIISEKMIVNQGKMFHLSLTETENISQQSITGLSDSLFKFSGKLTFQSYLGNIFNQPMHSTNSCINAFMYVSKYLNHLTRHKALDQEALNSNINEIGRYLGPVPTEENNFTLSLNLPDWEHSAFPTMFNVISTGFYNETSFNIAIFEEQFQLLWLERDTYNKSVMAVNNKFWFKDVNYSYNYRYSGNDINEYEQDSWQPNSVNLTVANSFEKVFKIWQEPLEKQKTLQREYLNQNVLFGHWDTHLIPSVLSFFNETTNTTNTRSLCDCDIPFIFHGHLVVIILA